MTDFRTLCTELVELDQAEPGDYADWRQSWNAAIARARAALAQPEPTPTDEELMAVFWEHENGLEEIWACDWPAAARAVLARWGNA